jgi:hypothetical protein
VYDEHGNVVALIAEDITGLGNELQRQLLRTRRSFSSTVLSADGKQQQQQQQQEQQQEQQQQQQEQGILGLD